MEDFEWFRKTQYDYKMLVYKRLQMTVVGLDKLVFIKSQNDQMLLNSWKETLICCESDVCMKNSFQRLCTMYNVHCTCWSSKN